MKVGNRLIAQSAEMGALGQLYAATDPAAESGKFYGPHGFMELRGYPVEVQPVAAATSEPTARRLLGRIRAAHGRHLGPAARPAAGQSASASWPRNLHLNRRPRVSSEALPRPWGPGARPAGSVLPVRDYYVD